MAAEKCDPREKDMATIMVAESEALSGAGELAAGMAHSLRNPLTSVKMRLYSLARTLDLSPEQKDDFDAISEEIRHMETLLRSFSRVLSAS